MNVRLKQLRKALNFTQQEFADRLKIKRNTVATYETGKSNPSDAAVSLICREFNVNEEWLRTGAGEMFKAAPSSVLDALAEQYGLTNAAYVMFEKFVNVKPEAQETIFNYVREVAAAFQSGEISPTAPAAMDVNLENLTIDQKVELYRQELEREEKAAEKSEVS